MADKLDHRFKSCETRQIWELYPVPFEALRLWPAQLWKALMRVEVQWLSESIDPANRSWLAPC